MKIKINQYESYNIEFPDEIGAQEFFAMKGRIDNIARLIGKDPLLQTAQDVPFTPIKAQRIRQSSTIEQRPWSQSREKAIKFVKCHYCGTDEEKAEYVKISGKPWINIYKRVSGLKQQHNIQPEEVGLTRFPLVGENASFKGVDHLKIQNETKTEIQEEVQEAPTL